MSKIAIVIYTIFDNDHASLPALTREGYTIITF